MRLTRCRHNAWFCYECLGKSQNQFLVFYTMPYFSLPLCLMHSSSNHDACNNLQRLSCILAHKFFPRFAMTWKFFRSQSRYADAIIYVAHCINECMNIFWRHAFSCFKDHSFVLLLEVLRFLHWQGPRRSFNFTHSNAFPSGSQV